MQLLGLMVEIMLLHYILLVIAFICFLIANHQKLRLLNEILEKESLGKRVIIIS